MALPSHLTLEIVTPERAIAHAEVDEVQIPGAEGYLGILPGHTPLLASLQVGQMWYRKGQERFYLSIAFGFAEILPDRVTILAQMAERAEEIDVERAEEEKRRAEAQMSKRASAADLEVARISMLKALSRLQAAQKARSRR
ncbi:MAG: F0F1 ATP synthase subunit epsilon [Acidobacteria bacterium]|nr:MAG: F0F1 ATP synthase subunit epsilon [Acidobacteriota bacterium]